MSFGKFILKAISTKETHDKKKYSWREITRQLTRKNFKFQLRTLQNILNDEVGAPRFDTVGYLVEWLKTGNDQIDMNTTWEAWKESKNDDRT